MTYVTKLRDAGQDPYRDELCRTDITAEETEALMEDTTYQRLAEVRYLACELYEELDRLAYEDSDEIDAYGVVGDYTREQTRDALRASNRAVHDYVKSWLRAYRKEADDG